MSNALTTARWSLVNQPSAFPWGEDITTAVLELINDRLGYPPPGQSPPKPPVAGEITADHWLDGAQRRDLPGGLAMNTRRFLVIHFTAGASAESSIDWWRSSKAASAHLVIDRDGTIFQCRPFNRTAGHAGVSEWRDPVTKEKFHSLNNCSIGIELANGGDAYPTKFSSLQPVMARHKHGGIIKAWERYPEAQLKACREVSELLVKRYHLDDVIGHEDIAPSRKVDPGPAFPMGELRMACGFSPDIQPI